MSSSRSPFPNHRARAFAWALAGSLLLALLVAAPGTSASEATQSADATLRARAEAYWKARIANETEKARGFYVPLPSGKLPVDIAEYGSVRFSSYSLEAVEVKGERGVVKVRVDASQFVKGVIGGHMKPSENLLRPLLVEEWRQVDGTWRKVAPDRSLTRIGRKPAEDAK